MAQHSFEIENGQTVTDKVTGFVGIVVGRVDYLTGCNQYLVQPKTKDGAHVESRWFDEHRLTVDPLISQVVLDAKKDRGADCAAPRK